MRVLYSTKNTKLNKKNQTNKIGLGISIAILAMVVLGFIAAFCNTHREGIFPVIGPTLLLYFSFSINILAAIISTINIVEFALVQKKKLNKVHNWLHICNLMLAVSLTFNFIFTFAYLIPLAIANSYDIEYLFAGTNMIFNLGSPILIGILYIFCFKDYSLKNRWLSLISIVPVLIYFIVYLILALTHIENGVTTSKYDPYMFGNKHWYMVILAFCISIICTSGISIGMYQLNRIGKLNRWMFIAVINIAIVVLMIPTSAWMFYYNIVHDSVQEGLSPVQTSFMRFLYFTHLSNWWLGAASVIYSIYAIKIYRGQIKTIPIWAQIVKLAGIAAVSITICMQFAVSAAYMIGWTQWSSWQECLTAAYVKCFQKYLMFEHFAIPFVAIATFILLEHGQLRSKHLLHAATPLAIYVLVYVIVVYSHLDQPLRKSFPGQEKFVTPWDIYDITEIAGSNGKYFYWVLPFVTYAGMLFLNWLFWLINRKIHFDLPKRPPAIAEIKQDWHQWKNRCKK